MKLKTENNGKIVMYIIPLMVFFFCYLAYYPGGFSPDSIDQYRQAILNQYNDWHPVLHTLITFKLPMTISSSWNGSIILFQIILFSLSLGYCFDIIYKYAGKMFTVLSMFFILANPLTVSIAMFPWKDVMFAIGTLLLMTFSLQLFITKGAWIKSPINMIAFIIVFVVTTIGRHNAILFTIPILVAIFFQISLKRFLLIIILIVSLFYTIKYPFYKMLNVENTVINRIDTFGLPLNIIAATVKYSPEKIDKRVLNFAYNIAPAEIWEKNYNYGIFNKVRYSSKMDKKIEQYERKQIIQLAILCFKKSPEVAFKSIVNLIKDICIIKPMHVKYLMPYVTKNSYNISFSSINFVRKIRYKLLLYNVFIHDFFPYLFLYYGIFHLIIIITIFNSSFSNFKICLFAFPIFLYNYGTAFMLMDNDDSLRYFYYIVLILPIFLLLFYRAEMCLNKKNDYN